MLGTEWGPCTRARGGLGPGLESESDGAQAGSGTLCLNHGTSLTLPGLPTSESDSETTEARSLHSETESESHIPGPAHRPGVDKVIFAKGLLGLHLANYLQT